MFYEDAIMLSLFIHVNMRIRIKRDIEKGQLCTREGGGRVNTPRILGRDVPSGSSNPDTISDQNMPFSIRLYALVVLLKTIPDFRP